MRSPILQKVIEDMNNQNYFKRAKRHWKISFEVLYLLGFREWFKHLSWKDFISNYKHNI